MSTFIAAMGVASISVVNTVASTCPRGLSLNIVAHQDDDILFLSPRLLHDIQLGRCVRTVFVTAGDAGQPPAFWQGRELGVRAGYAYMSADANGAWTQTDAGVPGHSIPMLTLADNPNISVIFLRLPDGSPDGTGFATNNYESTEKLWQGTISVVHSVDGANVYTRADLINTLLWFMQNLQPDQVNVQDFIGYYGDGDHYDHHTAAYLAQAANQSYTVPHTFTGFADYAVSNLPTNLAPIEFDSKQDTFEAYAQYDARVCPDPTANPPCISSYAQAYIPRQYTVPYPGQVTATPTLTASAVPATFTPTASATRTATATPSPSATATSGVTLTPTSTPSATASPLATVGPLDLALSATASASSENTSSGQTAAKAIDSVIDGYPHDYTKEWATVGGLAGSWLKLTWSAPQVVSRIVLHDRPNLNDQITGGTITFSDGSSVPVDVLNNDGSGVTLTFTSRTITSLQLTITSVAASTHNVGLSEIEVYAS